MQDVCDHLFDALAELAETDYDLDSASCWRDEKTINSLAIATTDPEIARELWNVIEKYINARPSSNG